MKAMILAAGFGTRMRPLTHRVPKPLLPLMLRPMLDRLLRQLQRASIDEIVINLHHQAEHLSAWLGDGGRWGLRLYQSYEPEILGTAGALKHAECYLGDEPFWVINSDVLIDLDFAAVWHAHQQYRAAVTMVLRHDPAARQYGAVVLDNRGRVQSINGRPDTAADVRGEDMMFTGLQVVSPNILAHIPPARFVGTTADVYPALIAEDQSVYGFRHTGYWMDIGTPDRYRQAHWDVLNGRVGDITDVPAATRVIMTVEDLSDAGRRTMITPPVVLGPDVTLAAGARVGPYAVLGSRCFIEADADIRDSVLWEDVHIGTGSCLDRTIIGAGVDITMGQVLHDTVCDTSDSSYNE